jgi:DNA-binding XRE family transcriptional regulator
VGYAFLYFNLNVFGNVFHGHFMVNSTVKLKRIKGPRLYPATRNITIGRLQSGESQNEVARTLNVNQSTISRLWNRFQQTGSTNDRQRSGRPHITTSRQDRYIRVFHLRNRTASTEAIHFLNTGGRETFIPAPIYTYSAITFLQQKTRLVAELNTSPVSECPAP